MCSRIRFRNLWSYKMPNTCDVLSFCIVLVLYLRTGYRPCLQNSDLLSLNSQMSVTSVLRVHTPLARACFLSHSAIGCFSEPDMSDRESIGERPLNLTAFSAVIRLSIAYSYRLHGGRTPLLPFDALLHHIGIRTYGGRCLTTPSLY